MRLPCPPAITTSLKHEVYVKPGEPLPEDALFVSCVGGTAITACSREDWR